MSILIALMLVAAPPAAAPAAPAPDWRPLGTARDRYVLAWDAASVVRGPEVVTVRFRTETIESPESSPHTISRLEMRCAAASAHVVESTTYRPDGTVSRHDIVPAAWETIPPGTPIATIQHAVC